VSVSSDYLAYVLEQLAGLGEVSSRRMFGGAGLYCGEHFFGLISGDDVLYLRADDGNRADYTARGMAAFRPYRDRPLVSMHYYEVPADVLDNARVLVTWAERSVRVARSAEARSARRPRRRAQRVSSASKRS
jgi:DNA transformation protein and related proteins